MIYSANSSPRTAHPAIRFQRFQRGNFGSAPASRVRMRGHPSESMGKNLDLGFEFVIVAEINDVVAAVAGTPLTTQGLGMDRQQK